jgi:hypothetical protein
MKFWLFSIPPPLVNFLTPLKDSFKLKICSFIKQIFSSLIVKKLVELHLGICILMEGVFI